jgi:hypothetical protein
MAPLALSFFPAILSPIHAPASLPSIIRTPFDMDLGVFDALQVANVPMPAWDLPPTLGWENSPATLASRRFSQFSGIGTLLD